MKLCPRPHFEDLRYGRAYFATDRLLYLRDRFTVVEKAFSQSVNTLS
jgi:hypothetical protein